MKRNWDVVREILLCISNHGISYFNSDSVKNIMEKYQITDQEVWYHLEILCQAGYLNAEIDMGMEGYCEIASTSLGGLTWEGQNLLEDISSPERWGETKEVMKKVGGGGVETLKIAIQEIVKIAIKVAVAQ